MTVHAPTRADLLPVTEDLANLTVFGLVGGKTHKTKEGALATYLGDVTLEQIQQAITELGYSASDVLAKLKTVDGTGSGLDADLFRGLAPSDFASRNNAALIGEPTAPTPSAGNNSNRIATTAFARALFDQLIDAAPGTLDTLNELAAALGDDPNFAATMATALAAKAPLASPALTGTPTAPTADVATNNTQIATTAFVKLVVAQLIDTAPDALNTLQELAAALGNDSDFANTMLTALAGKANVDEVLVPASGRLDKINIPKFGGVFDVLDYVRQLDVASAEAIEAFDGAAQDEVKVLQAVHAAGDDALAYIKSKYNASALVKLPAGTIMLRDEFFSDSFQSDFWNQTSIFFGKSLIVQGQGRDVTTVQVSSNYISACRNTLNGNQRTYGPWANEPSPSILFPCMASVAAGAPASISLRGMRLQGAGIPGRDPIAILKNHDLQAENTDLLILSFDNSGHHIMGAYNSSWNGTRIVGCGAQPVEGGSLLGNAPGFPPSWVYFDVATSGGVTTVTAKARASQGGYAIGDVVPWFNSSQIGKTMAFQQAATHAGVPQTLKATIATIVSPSQATVTILGGVVVPGAAVTGKSGSFFPVKATTVANSAAIVLSDKVKLGRGARDMIGQIVHIPKAGSKTVTTRDLMCARVLSCDTGDDTDGYTGLTLTSQARFSATDSFIWSAARSSANEEKFAGTWQVNDTDFTNYQVENASGYGVDTTTSAFQFIASGEGNSVNYTACKFHGADPTRGQFAAEGNAIIDDAYGVSFVGSDFTHLCNMGTGQVRLIGARCRMNFLAGETESWQLPYDFSAFYADPMSGYAAIDWSVRITPEPVVLNKTFPVLQQKLFAGRAGLSQSDIARIFRRDFSGPNGYILLTSADDMDNVKAPGRYYTLGTLPSNAFPFANYSIIDVLAPPTGAGEIAVQIGYDSDNRNTFVRNNLSGAWSPWRSIERRVVSTSTAIAALGDAINTTDKYQGKMVFLSDNNRLAIAQGATAADGWSVFNVDSTVTPA